VSWRDDVVRAASGTEVENPPREWLSTVLSVTCSIAVVLLAGLFAMRSCVDAALDDFDYDSAGNLADPKGAFTKYTGLAWPSEGRIGYVFDDHGWPSDGTFYLIIEVDRATLDRWKAGPPPFGAEKWTTEPLPDEATTSCYFKKDVSFARNGIVHYTVGEKIRKPGWTSDSGLVRAHDAPTTWRAWLDRSPAGFEWHDGSFLALDFERNLVWLSVWDG